MSAKTIFPGGNTTFLPALAGLPNTTPVPISVSTLTASGAITSTAGTVGVVDPNSGAITYNTSGLTLSRNISNGQDEYDIIAVNTLTQNSLNIYTSSVSVVGGVTQPTLALASTGNVTANRGSITAQTGLTATTGNITASAGSITAQTGLTATTGNITATTGNITATAGNITATAGNITATAGGVFSGGGFTANGGGIAILNAGDAGPAGVYNTNHTLNITQNLSNAENEFDFIAINSTSTEGMAFYCGDATVPVNNATLPALKILIGGIVPLRIYDSTGSAGAAGQILSAGAAGGSVLWIDPA